MYAAHIAFRNRTEQYQSNISPETVIYVTFRREIVFIPFLATFHAAARHCLFDMKSNRKTDRMA